MQKRILSMISQTLDSDGTTLALTGKLFDNNHFWSLTIARGNFGLVVGQRDDWGVPGITFKPDF
jgi:hypothetical protein